MNISDNDKTKAINFIDWLMSNCELSEDQTIWSYEGEDYSLEGIYELFNNKHTIEQAIKKANQIFNNK